MKAARKYKAKPSKNTKTAKHQLLQKKEEASFFGAKNKTTPFFSPNIQTKLIVGKPNDKYEQEADNMAKQVGKMPNNPFANTPQLKSETNNKICCCPSCNLQRKEKTTPNIQTKKIIQTKAENQASDGLETTLQNTKGQGHTLPKETNLQMKQVLGQDFSGVTIHTDNKAIQMNQELQSQAFTHGSDVYFNQGKYNPHSNDGQQLLAHELTHVVQQTGTAQKKPIAQTGGHRIQRGLWGSIKKGFKKVGSSIKKGVSKVGKGIKKGVGWLGGKAKSAFKWIGKTAKGAFGWLKSGAKKIGSWLRNTGSKAWKSLKSKVGKAWNWIKSKGKAGWSWLKSKGKWLWSGLKKAGKWLKKTAGKVWNGLKWVGKQLWSKMKGIYYRTKRFFTKLPSRLKRLGIHLWNGLKSLQPWSLSWWKSLGKASTWKSFGTWLGELVIHGLETIGIGEIYETAADFIKFNTRGLTGGEIATAKTVFGNSIDYNLVRIDERAVLGPSWTGRAYVSFHTINSWGALSSRTLIHELTHVWQYENMGAMYMPRAIHAQSAGGYNYGGIPALEANKGVGMSAFNLEQQGEILGDYYTVKNNASTPAATISLYEIYVNEVRNR